MNIKCIPIFLFFHCAFATDVDFTAVGMDGMTVQFLDASIYENNNAEHSYVWDFGDGTISEDQNPIHTYTAEGVYAICLSVDGMSSVCKKDTFFVSKNGLVVKYDDTIWPNGEISTVSSPFGPRWKQSDSRYDFHRGIDIPGNSGDPIMSIADGVVYAAYVENDPNNTFSSTAVVVQHTMETPFFFHGKFIKNYFSVSLHLTSIANGIQKGTTVKKGDLIGTVGQTGDTNFDHNHFEIRVGVLCSRESQRKGSCSTSNPFDGIVDPHVNPLLFLDYQKFNANSLRFDVLQENPLVVKIISNRPELDFNRIEIVKGSERKSLDINLRQGIDPENIDGNPYDEIAIDPGFYTSNGNEDYELTLTFEEFSSVDEIVVSDIWGSTSNLLNDEGEEDVEEEEEGEEDMEEEEEGAEEEDVEEEGEEGAEEEDVEGDIEREEGIEEVAEIFPYPNPFSETVYFAQIPEEGQYYYQLFDVLGSLVKQGKIENSISFQNLANGLYYLKLVSITNQERLLYKILKK